MMTKSQRIAVFSILLILLVVLWRFYARAYDVSDSSSVLIFSALLMLAFVTQFIEHYFTKPTDALAAAVSVLLMLAPLRSQLDKWGGWYDLLLYYCLAIVIWSVTALLLLDDRRGPDSVRNRTSQVFRDLAVHLGNGRVLYLAVFLFASLFYVDSQNVAFLLLVGYAGLVLAADPHHLLLKLPIKKRASDQEVGVIFGVQSKNTFLVKLHDRPDRPTLRLSDLLEFEYGMDESAKVRRGVILDRYFLDQEQWVKVLAHDQIAALMDPIPQGRARSKDAAYRVEHTEASGFFQRFVGIVLDGSTIAQLRFQYCGRVSVGEGTLLEAMVDHRRILYQVVQGITAIEPLQLKNETGFIVGEAVQLGEWDSDKTTFERYGWVPEVNTPLFLASDVDTRAVDQGEICVGCVPGTQYQVILRKQVAITHHMAVLGVTGAGKSVFTRNLIRQFLDEDTRVICVDFTREYAGKFADLLPTPIVDGELANRIFRAIDLISLEKARYADKQDRNLIKKQEDGIATSFREAIAEFLKGSQRLTIFELADVANTEGVFEYTRWFFKVLFEIARNENSYGKRVCVVLEEAHTVIPEWNFIGLADKTSQSLVNNIGQIALQGRKYNVGFVVIAQRTANVSKTVLTQCNTIIAFQCFDSTSRDFLSNYLPKEMVAALPNLRFRQAIAVGKGFKASVPLIFEVPTIVEPGGAELGIEVDGDFEPEEDRSEEAVV